MVKEEVDDMKLEYKTGGNEYCLDVVKEGEKFVLELQGKKIEVSAAEHGAGFLQFKLNGKMYKSIVTQHDNYRQVFLNGNIYRLTRREAKRIKGSGESEGDLTSPISGKVVSIKAKEGQKMDKDDVIMIIEAMKMEYTIKAPYKGKVTKLHFKEGDQVEIGALLADMERPKEKE